MNKSRLILIFTFLCITCLVQAKEEDKEDKRYLLSKETYDLLNVARVAMEENSYHTVDKTL